MGVELKILKNMIDELANLHPSSPGESMEKIRLIEAVIGEHIHNNRNDKGWVNEMQRLIILHTQATNEYHLLSKENDSEMLFDILMRSRNVN